MKFNSRKHAVIHLKIINYITTVSVCNHRNFSLFISTSIHQIINKIPYTFLRIIRCLTSGCVRQYHVRLFVVPVFIWSVLVLSCAVHFQCLPNTCMSANVPLVAIPRTINAIVRLGSNEVAVRMVWSFVAVSSKKRTICRRWLWRCRRRRTAIFCVEWRIGRSASAALWP